MKTSYRCIIVVPCHNEELRLDASLFRAFAEANPDIGFIMVDDGSTDSTLKILSSLRSPPAPQTSNLKSQTSFAVISNPSNLGKAESVRLGVLAACVESPEFVGFWDADLATPLCDIRDFIDEFERNRNFDIVTGARVKRLSCTVERGFFRHYCGRVFATFVSMKLRLGVYDTQCGAKIFRKDVAESIFDLPFATRWFFDVELLMRYMKKYGREAAVERICEKPVSSWTDGADSKVNLIRALFEFIRLMFL